MDSSTEDEDDDYYNSFAKRLQILKSRFSCEQSPTNSDGSGNDSDEEPLSVVNSRNSRGAGRRGTRGGRKQSSRPATDNVINSFNADDSDVIVIQDEMNDNEDLPSVLNSIGGSSGTSTCGTRGRRKLTSCNNSMPVRRGRSARAITIIDLTNNNGIAMNGVEEYEVTASGRRGSRARRSRGRTSVQRERAKQASYPTYSVGNTDYYPDQSENVELFSKKPSWTKNSDAEVVIEEDNISENEELSVKVYWMSERIVKFTMRRFQTLKKIFEHFSKEVNIGTKILYFNYNGTILKPTNTLHDINYSIAKFIEGGIVDKKFSSVVNGLPGSNKGDTLKGVVLKFQCQNIKKPILLGGDLDERLNVRMVKLAEMIEKPLEKLHFYFDGERISGTETSRELELEGGECIDVKIVQ